jgi:CBS domain containing-hemolysin-like protein
MLVTASAQGGVVEEDESEMLHAIFDMAELMVRQVMIPRTEMIAVEADTPLAEIIDLVSETTYTKFPVYEDSLDQVLGIVHVKRFAAGVREDYVDFVAHLQIAHVETILSAPCRRLNHQHIVVR